MHIIFFQNCVSPHQMPYIRCLAQRADVAFVTVVAPRVTCDGRVGLGWSSEVTTEPEHLQVMIAPSDDDVFRLYADLERKSSSGICLYGGIRADRHIFRWFRMGMLFNFHRGLITEPPYLYRYPLWMHRLRFLIQDFRFVPSIDFVFAIGKGCADYYRSWSRRWRVIPFYYTPALPIVTTDLNEGDADSRNLSTMDRDVSRVEIKRIRLLFVGELSHRKNLILLLRALGSLSPSLRSAFHLTVIGGGDEKERLLQETERLGLEAYVDYKGVLPMEQVQQEMAVADVLVLPSLHDGWGAVVNEALYWGVYPLCSIRCGATQLWDEMPKHIRPITFSPTSVVQLSSSLERLYTDRHSILSLREERRLWAWQYIAPECAAECMRKALDIF